MTSNGNQPRSIETVQALALAMLADRGGGKTLCPSEVARAFAGAGNWREAMPIVHAAIDHLLASGKVRLSWKGEALTTRAGPYRISLSPTDQSG